VCLACFCFKTTQIYACFELVYDNDIEKLIIEKKHQLLLLASLSPSTKTR
jgi:hypothetical protein